MIKGRVCHRIREKGLDAWQQLEFSNLNSQGMIGDLWREGKKGITI